MIGIGLFHMLDLFELFRIGGIIGLLCIITGMLLKSKERKRRDYLYFAGGVLLTAYSIFLGDLIFIILQVVFTAAAVYDYYKIRN